MPDPIVGADPSQQQTQTTPQTPEVSTPASATPTVSPVASQPVPAAAQTTGQPAGFSVLGALKSRDPRFAEHFQDDQSALDHLWEGYRNGQSAQQLASYGQVYLQHADKFNAYMRQQQEEEARKQAADAENRKRWFNLPEYNPDWLSQVSRDPVTQEWKVNPGSPPDVLQKLTAYGHARKNLEDKFWQDPMATLGPMVEHIATEKAKAIAEQNMSGYKDQVFAKTFIEGNSDWLHAKDATGQKYIDQRTGKYALSQTGIAFGNYVLQAENAGMRNVEDQQQYALGMVQRDYFVSQLRQQMAAQAAAAPVAPGAARQPSAGASVPGNSLTAPAAPSQNASLPLAQRLQNAFQAAGLQDAAFR